MHDALIAWDSCILIDAIQRTPGRWGAVAPMINLGTTGELKIILSTISVAEVFWLKDAANKGATNDQQQAMIEGWLETPYLIKRAADFGTCQIAAEIGRRTKNGIQTADAIIAATAIRHRAGALITIDSGLLKQDGVLPSGDGTLRICTPEAWTRDNSPQLFDH